MKPFTFMYGQRPWPPGLTLLHIYVVVDLGANPELAALIKGCRDATRDYPLSHVGDDWFHITMCQIDLPAGQVTRSEREALATELRGRLHEVPPFTVMVGSAFSCASGVIFDVGPDEPLNDLRAHVAAAVEAVRGAGEAGLDTSVLHLTESYALADADSDQVQRRLWGVRPSHVPLLVDAVELVDVAAGLETKTITWQQVARVRLGDTARRGTEDLDFGDK